MNFDDFFFESVILDLRYDKGFLYLDNFGKFLIMLTDLYPSIKTASTNPNESKIQIEGKTMDIVVGPDKCRLRQYNPKDLNEFEELSIVIVTLLYEIFRIESFSRIGNRFISILPTNNIDESRDVFEKTGLISRNEKLFKQFDQPYNELKIKLNYANDDIGCTFISHIAERKLLNTQLPFPAQIDAEWFKPNGFILDLDFFTTKAVDFSMLIIDDFINSSLNKLKKIISSI